MTNNGKDGMWEQVYHLRDIRGRIVFTGTKEEIMEFEPCTSDNFYETVRRGYRLHGKYTVERAYKREVKELMCGQCGKVLPVSKMRWRKRKDGSKVPITVCKKCNMRYTKEYERKKRHERCVERSNSDVRC